MFYAELWATTRNKGFAECQKCVQRALWYGCWGLLETQDVGEDNGGYWWCWGIGDTRHVGDTGHPVEVLNSRGWWGCFKGSGNATGTCGARDAGDTIAAGKTGNTTHKHETLVMLGALVMLGHWANWWVCRCCEHWECWGHWGRLEHWECKKPWWNCGFWGH